MNNINISLIIPCFENLNSFKDSLSSAINQKYKPEQIIIVDSSLSNKIRNILKKIISKILQLKFIIMKKFIR